MTRADLSEEVYRPCFNTQKLVLPATYLGPPLPPRLVQQPASLLWVQEDRTCVPTVFDGQIVQRPQNAGPNLTIRCRLPWAGVQLPSRIF